MSFYKKYYAPATKLTIAAAVLFYGIYAFPFFKNFTFSKELANNLTISPDGIYNPLFRSLAFSIIGSFFVVCLSLLIASFLERIQITGQKGKWMSLLLMPFILGSVSTAFIWKLLLLDTIYPFSSATSKFITLTSIQFWQYGTLYVYLFWINQHLISQSSRTYAKVIGLNRLEKLRDLLFPQQRHLVMLLYIITMITFYYEDAKIQFIFHASRGTDTELVNQWLQRMYHSDSLLSPDFAFKHMSQLGGVILISAFIGLLASLLLKNGLYRILITNRLLLPRWTPPKLFNTAMYYLLLLYTLSPIFFIFYFQRVTFTQLFDYMSLPLLLTTFAALLATLVAIWFAIINRLALPKLLSSFNGKSIFFLIALFLMTLVPPVVTLILSFKWMRIVGYDSSNTIYWAWIIGHVFLSFPMLASFLITSHFRLKNNQITYLDVHITSFGDKLKTLFLYSFAADYMLTFVLAFSLIWNESTINNVLADIVPSFFAELNKTITGKSVDYASGMNYLVISLVLAVISILLWNRIVGKVQKNTENEFSEI